MGDIFRRGKSSEWEWVLACEGDFRLHCQQGCLPFVRMNRLVRALNNGKVFPNSANQPNEIALTICNSISRNCFRLMRDWKLETGNLKANGKEISAVPFRTEKEEYL